MLRSGTRSAPRAGSGAGEEDVAPGPKLGGLFG